jgi:hypothetical protein
VGLKHRAEAAISRWALALDKNTVTYGFGPDMFLDGGVLGYGWACGRCIDGKWSMSTLAEAKTDAEKHAGTHSRVHTHHEEEPVNRRFDGYWEAEQ